MAQELDLPVFMLELGTFTNGDCINWFRHALAAAPCLVLLEDLDAVFEGRQNKLGKDGGGLSSIAS